MATPPTNTSFVDSYGAAPSFTPEDRQSMLGQMSTAWHLSDIQPLGSSTWWHSKKVGADFYTVEHDGQRMVLKMQYAPTNPSEISLLEHFEIYSQTAHLPFRPPHLYESQAKDRDHLYEALLLEDVQGLPVLPYPTNTQEIEALAPSLHHFLQLAYATATVPASAFPELPQTSPRMAAQSVQDHFASWQEFRNTHFPKHSFTHPNDQGEILSDPALITQAIQTLANSYEGISLRFQHGHMGRGDVVQTTDGDIVLFSNLKWGWYVPYRNVAFHEWWYLYECADQKNLSADDIVAIHTQQEQAFARLAATLSPEEQHLLTLARLERASAALNLDVLTLPDNEKTRKAAELTKQAVTRLLSEAVDLSFLPL